MPVISTPSAWKRQLGEWALLCAALAAVAAAALGWHASEVKRLLGAEQQRMDVFANIIATDVADNLVAVNQALAGVIRDRLSDPAHIDAEALNRRLMALSEAMPSVRGMIALDVVGNVTAAAPTDLVGRNFARRAYFSVPRRDGNAATFYLSPPFRSVRGDIVVSASRMVPGAHGRFGGVVSAVLAPRYFTAMLRTVSYAPDVRAIVAFDDGAPVIEVAAVAAPARAPWFGQLASLRAQRDIGPAALGMDHVLGVVLTRDPAAVVAELDRQAALFAALFAGFGAAALMLLAWAQRRRRRLHQLEADRRAEHDLAATLRDSETRFRTLIEEAPVAVAIVRAGHFVYTNRRYNVLHGQAAGDSMAGMPWRSMLTPESLAQLSEQQALIAADSPVEQYFEATGRGSDGRRVPLFKATTRVELSDGPATLIFTQDISKQKRAEAFLLEARDAAEAANRSKAEFLANMSHEIRTPLNAILGLAYLLEQAELGADAQAMLSKIRASGRSLLGIINDVLDVSKIEAGAMTLDRSWFALQDVIDDVAATMGVAVGEKDIALLIAPLPHGAASIMGDALRLGQLLVNLTSNAIKFTASGTVELAVLAGATKGERTELTFEVRDSGIGIAPAQQQAIFAPFTQADSSTTRRYGGTGLGLTICKQLVTLMGGQIGVRSAVDGGSVFWFTIPLQCMAAASPPPKEAAGAPAMAVLVIGARGGARDNLAALAQSLGWDVDIADVADGTEGAEVAEAAEVAEVTDAATGLPVSGAGAAVLAQLRRCRQQARLPAALLLDSPGDCSAAVALADTLRGALGAAACPVVLVASTYAVAAFKAGAGASAGGVDAILTRPPTATSLQTALLEARRRRASLQQGLAAAAARAPQLAGLRLLVVDDSEINREVARRILSDQGATVTLAADGSEALAWLSANPDQADLVLMDVQMPVMDGIEATRRLRAMACFERLPIVALTAGAFQSHHDAARAAGMSHFITKPFDIPLTIALIRRLTGLAEDAALGDNDSVGGMRSRPRPRQAAGAGLAKPRRSS